MGRQREGAEGERQREGGREGGREGERERERERERDWGGGGVVAAKRHAFLGRLMCGLVI